MRYSVREFVSKALLLHRRRSTMVRNRLTIFCIAAAVVLLHRTPPSAAQSKYGPGRPYDALDKSSPAQFELLDDGWDGRGRGAANLNFHLVNDPARGSLAPDVARRIILESLALWATVAEINWTETTSPGRPQTVDIEWARIDGASQILGQAAPPPLAWPEPEAGDLTLDQDEDWIDGFSANPFFGASLLPVVIHELGHSLGLDHTPDARAIMFATYNGGSVSALSADDVAGIRDIYASRFPAFAARVYGRHSAIGDLMIRVGAKDREGGTTLWQRDVHLRFGGDRNDFDYVEIDLSEGRSFVNGSNDWFAAVEDVASGDAGSLDGFVIRIDGETVSSFDPPTAIVDRRTTTAYIRDLGNPVVTPPTNDDCRTPGAVSALPFFDIADLSSATREIDDPHPTCETGALSSEARTVWYEFIPTHDTLLQIEAEGAVDVPLAISALVGVCGTLAELECATGESVTTPGASPRTLAQLDAVMAARGTPILFQVAQNDDADGAVVVRITEIAAGDECDGPIALVDAGSTVSVDAFNATTASTDPPICKRAGASVWFTYIPPSNGVIHVDTLGSSYDTVLAVFSGSCGNLQELACNDDADGSVIQSMVSEVGVLAGESIRIMVGAFGGDVGAQLQLALRFVSPPQLVSSFPPDGFIDPLDETGGVDSIVWILDRAVLGTDGLPLTEEAFSLVATDNPEIVGPPNLPEIVQVTTDDRSCATPPCPFEIVLTLSASIPPGEWTTLHATVTDEAGNVGAIESSWAHLPGDINRDGVVDISDATAFGSEFHGQRRLERIDLDRSGSVTIRDATHFGALWNGTGSGERPWRGVRLPPQEAE